MINFVAKGATESSCPLVGKPPDTEPLCKVPRGNSPLLGNQRDSHPNPSQIALAESSSTSRLINPDMSPPLTYGTGFTDGSELNMAETNNNNGSALHMRSSCSTLSDVSGVIASDSGGGGGADKLGNMSSIVGNIIPSSCCENEDKSVYLKRRVGLLSGTALIVGTMIGSGIFISPMGLLKRTKSVGLSLTVWAACGVLSTLGALCYAELGTCVPLSGGEYAYYLHAFRPKTNKVCPPSPESSQSRPSLLDIPAYLFSWTSVLLLRPASMSIICLTCATYLLSPIENTSNIPPYVHQLMAAFLVVLVTMVNCFSVKAATSVQNSFTAAKLLAIGIIIVVGGIRLFEGHTEHLASGFEGSTTNMGDIATAFYSGLWAYDGWNNLNYITEEIKNPYVNLPRAIILGLPLVTMCYVAVNAAYLTVLSPADLLASEAVAVTFGDRVLGVMAWCIPLFVACSTFGAANGSCFTGGRLSYVAAREGHLVDVLSYVHVRRYTPSPALLFNAAISLLMVIPGDIGSLIDFFSFTAWIFYGSAMLALIVMRHTHKHLHRPYKVPIIIPYIVLLASVFLVIAPIVDDPQVEYLYASLFIFAGLLFYFPFVYFKLQLRFIRKLTIWIQLILEVVPSEATPSD